MLADIKQPEPKDLTRINVHDELEAQRWSVRFSVTPQALRAAVKKLGPRPEEVRKKLHAAAKKSARTEGGRAGLSGRLHRPVDLKKRRMRGCSTVS